MKISRPPYLSCWAAGVIIMLVAQQICANDIEHFDPLIQVSPVTIGASDSVIIDITKAGARLVAVGEKGIIIYSDDNGDTWVQAKVPVSVTLTAVYFINSEHGWSVGHSGVVIKTRDGGHTWVKQLDGMQITKIIELEKIELKKKSINEASLIPIVDSSDPLFDIFFFDNDHGLVIGAFGIILETRNSGKTWSLYYKHISNLNGDHLYSLKSENGKIIIAGERGALFISTDNGQSFSTINTPYKGSYFGVLLAADESIVVFGLQGNIFRSIDYGRTWESLNLGINSSWTGGTVVDDGSIVLVSQAGHIAISSDNGKSYKLLPVYGNQLTDVHVTTDDYLILTSMRGISKVKLVQ